MLVRIFQGNRRVTPEPNVCDCKEAFLPSHPTYVIFRSFLTSVFLPEDCLFIVRPRRGTDQSSSGSYYSAVPKRSRSKHGQTQKHENENIFEKSANTNERKRAQTSAKEHFSVKIVNNQVWELPNVLDRFHRLSGRWCCKSMSDTCSGCRKQLALRVLMLHVLSFV